MGECDKDTTFEILDYFYDQGGNFIDTANNYQNEESETWIGEWMEKRGVRDQMVLATKVRTSMMIMLSVAKNRQYTTGYRSATDSKAIQSNYTGNNAKSLHLSLEASLKKLKTSYVDVLYVHWWDYTVGLDGALL